MLNNPMLLGQILLCEALNLRQLTRATTSHISSMKTNRSIRIAIGKLLPNELVHPVFLRVIVVGAARAHQAGYDERHGGVEEYVEE